MASAYHGLFIKEAAVGARVQDDVMATASWWWTAPEVVATGVGGGGERRRGVDIGDVIWDSARSIVHDAWASTHTYIMSWSIMGLLALLMTLLVVQRLLPYRFAIQRFFAKTRADHKAVQRSITKGTSATKDKAA
jgi:hypothetical protein